MPSVDVARKTVSVSDSETTLFTLENLPNRVYFLTIMVESATGSDALNSFKIYAKSHDDDSWVARFTSSEWTGGTTENLRELTTQTPHTLEAEEVSKFSIQCYGDEKVKITATCAATNSASITITCRLVFA
jgi:hypothetical protein